WTLRPGRPVLTVSQEFARTASHAAGPRKLRRAPVGPWVIPLPSPPPAAPAGALPAPPTPPPVDRPVAERRPKGTFVGGRLAEPPVPAPADRALESTKLKGAGWVDPFGDGEPGNRACHITVNSIPWSEVWIDGKNTAQHTPLVDYEVDCGLHV